MKGTKPEMMPCFADFPLMLSDLPVAVPAISIRTASMLVGRQTEKYVDVGSSDSAKPLTRSSPRGPCSVPGRKYSRICRRGSLSTKLRAQRWAAVCFPALGAPLSCPLRFGDCVNSASTSAQQNRSWRPSPR